MRISTFDNWDDYIIDLLTNYDWPHRIVMVNNMFFRQFYTTPPNMPWGGMAIKDIEIGGMDPTCCHPKPDQLPYGTFDLATQALGIHLVKNRYK